MEPKGTILLVEDERMVALAEARALEQEGYAVVWASSGGEALERIAVSPLPDLVLMDMNLGGGLDGLEVARAILRQHDLPVVFLSSHTDRETVERSRQITSYGYVVKGTGTAVLLAAVETARELFSARRGAQESRRLYRDTVLSVQEGIAVLDQDLRYVVWNRFMEELTGISAEELLGRSVEECPFPLWDRGTDQFLLPALQGERVDAEDTPFFVPSTGRRGWVRGSFAPRRDAAGRVSGVLVTVGNLTVRKQSEEVLRQLAAIVAGAQDAIIGQTPEGVITFWNPGAERLYGYTAEEMMGQTLLCLVPSDRAGEPELLRRFPLAGESITAFDTVRRARDGSLKDVSLSIFPLRDDAGAVAGIASIARDMTAQRRAERAAEENRSHVEALMNAQDQLMALVDRRGGVLEGNEALARHWGISRLSLRGRGLFQNMDRRTATLWRRALGRCFRQGAPQHWEEEYGGRHYEIDAFPVTSPGGEVRRAAVTLRDVTERIRSRRALKDLEGRYQALFENVRDLLVVMDPEERRILEVNAATLEELGYSRGEMEGRRVDDFNDPAALPPEEIARRAEEARRAGRADFETVLRRRDGSAFPAEVHTQAVSFGDRVAILGAARNVSARVEAQRLLERSLKERELHLKELHHRVKNTLATILALLSVEERRSPSPEAQEALGRTARRVRTMASLYDQLRPTDQGASSIDLGSYLATVARSFAGEPEDRGTPAVCCTCSPTPLDLRRSVACGLIVNELVTNAVKHAFAPGAPGTVEVDLVSQGPEVEVRVADDGVGLPPGMEEGRPGSSGMELVRLLTSQLEGRLTVSREGGTTWTLRFPR